MKSVRNLTAGPRVVVVGSLNLDLIARVARIPAAGETVSAHRVLRRFGGKGANQAVAAARQGARVEMIGCVGNDADGAAYRQHLKEREGIGLRGVRSIAGENTGTAFIAVDDRGENQIIVAAGANARLSAADVHAQARVICRAQALLVQLEVPLSAVLEAMRIANAAGVRVVFNPSPWRDDFPWGQAKIDVAVVNELEVRQMLGRAVGELVRRPAEGQARLSARGVSQLIVTRGPRPTLCLSASGALQVPALRVKPVDTVGAGDAFAGALAARLAEGCPVSNAVAFANCAGALATLKTGAQEAIPSRAEVEARMRKLRKSRIEFP